MQNLIFVFWFWGKLWSGHVLFKFLIIYTNILLVLQEWQSWLTRWAGLCCVLVYWVFGLKISMRKKPGQQELRPGDRRQLFHKDTRVKVRRLIVNMWQYVCMQVNSYFLVFKTLFSCPVLHVFSLNIRFHTLWG